MKLAALALIALIAAPAAAAPHHRRTTQGISNAALIAAAKAAKLKSIDPQDDYCDGQTRIAAWLQDLTGAEARRIAWSAGACDLVNNLNPLDKGGRFCVQARLMLKHPKNKADTPEIEIYLKDPKRGRPGAAYAFRAVFDSGDGPDYIRFRRDFEAAWRDRFKNAPARRCAQD